VKIKSDGKGGALESPNFFKCNVTQDYHDKNNWMFPLFKKLKYLYSLSVFFLLQTSDRTFRGEAHGSGNVSRSVFAVFRFRIWIRPVPLIFGLKDPNPDPPLFHAKLRNVFKNVLKSEQIHHNFTHNAWNFLLTFSPSLVHRRIRIRKSWFSNEDPDPKWLISGPEHWFLKFNIFLHFCLLLRLHSCNIGIPFFCQKWNS